MLVRRLIFLGPEEAEGVPSLEGAPLTRGHAIPLEHKRSPWPSERDLVRVIVGTHVSRADVLLQARGLFPEHARFYFQRHQAGSTDFRPLHPESSRVDGRNVDGLEWIRLRGGEEIDLGPWRFRYEEAEA